MRNIPVATGRRSPPRRKMGGLDRGVVDADQLEWLKAVDAAKRRRPFLDLTELRDILLALGYRKVKEVAPSLDVAEMRAEYESRVEELRAAELRIETLECELTTRTRERTYATEEAARLERLLGKVRAALAGIDVDIPDKTRLKEVRRELAEIKAGRFALFGAEILPAFIEKQADLEADIATLQHVVTGDIATAMKTLAKA